MSSDKWAIRSGYDVSGRALWVSAEDTEEVTLHKALRATWDRKDEALMCMADDGTDVLVRIRRVPSARMRAALRANKCALALLERLADEYDNDCAWTPWAKEARALREALDAQEQNR